MQSIFNNFTLNIFIFIKLKKSLLKQIILIIKIYILSNISISQSILLNVE